MAEAFDAALINSFASSLPSNPVSLVEAFDIVSDTLLLTFPTRFIVLFIAVCVALDAASEAKLSTLSARLIDSPVALAVVFAAVPTISCA